jgi:site-specific DNA-methyltransferase (adenine-specific)
VLDFFAGSGTTGVAAAKHGRSFVMVDESTTAVAVMEKRLAAFSPRRDDPPLPAVRKAKRRAPASRRSRQ